MKFLYHPIILIGEYDFPRLTFRHPCVFSIKLKFISNLIQFLYYMCFSAILWRIFSLDILSGQWWSRYSRLTSSPQGRWLVLGLPSQGYHTHRADEWWRWRTTSADKGEDCFTIKLIFKVGMLHLQRFAISVHFKLGKFPPVTLRQHLNFQEEKKCVYRFATNWKSFGDKFSSIVIYHE